jgi:protein-S-isoprenylcysteine O-methyltransferase Ste14
MPDSTFKIIFAIGLGVYLFGVYGLILLFIPLYLIRVPREERMMLEHFGDEYRDYVRRTGRIFPRASA